MQEILLTGGSGFIGKNLKESFLAQKYNIIAPTHKELDLLDTAAVDNFFKNRRFDVVLHSATKPGHRNAKDATQLLYSNLRIFQNLERNRGSFGRFINFGSGAVFNVKTDISGVVEDDAFNEIPEDEHGFCKYVVQKQICKLSNFIDLNIFGIFGKYEDYSIRFISNAICKALIGLPITLRQNRRFSYISVEDLPKILDQIISLKNPKPTYNITSDGYVELLDIANLICKKLCNRTDILLALDGYGLDYYGSNMRLKKDLGTVEFSDMEESIDRLIEYYDSIKANINIEWLKVDK